MPAPRALISLCYSRFLSCNPCTIFPMKQWNIKFLIAIPFPDFSYFMQPARLPTVSSWMERGKTGILSASGRVAAYILLKTSYAYGSYDSYLSSGNITWENFSFGYSGVAEIIRGQGLGFASDETMLGRLSIRRTRCFPIMGN